MAQFDHIQWPGWEVVRVIGNGTFGSVYEIQRSLYGNIEKAALKVICIPQNKSDIDELFSDGFDEESITARFNGYLEDIVREYSLMTAMKGNKNVVYCDDIRQIQHDDGLGWDIYIKMELLTPLVKTLGKTISESEVVKLGIDMCSALVKCKEHNIVHRDIKPQNIFVSDDGTYKLGDFGIAKTAERTTSGTKTGTYKYMAPEVYKALPYGAAADQYSLGLVLYWMLNERRTPFLPLPSKVKATTVSMEEEARKRRLSGEPIPKPAHGSEALKQIVLKACAYDPKDRYESAAEMLAALRTLQGGTAEEVSAAPMKKTPVIAADIETEEDKTEGTVDVFDVSRKHESAEIKPAEEDTKERLPDENENSEPVSVGDIAGAGTKEEKETRRKKPWILLIPAVAVIALIVLLVTGTLGGGKLRAHQQADTDEAVGLAISTQPRDYDCVLGETAHFTVNARGTGLVYQWEYLAPNDTEWKKSGMDGCRTATLKVEATEARNGQQYRCIITDKAGETLTTGAATLTVITGESGAKQLDWTEWSDTLPSDITADKYDIEERTLYSSRMLETTSSTKSDKMDGWELYDTATGNGDFGAWSDWSQTAVTKSDTRDVETQTRYRYRDKETTTSSSSSKSGWTLDNTTYSWGSYGAWSDWSATTVSNSDSRQVETQARYRYRDKETTTSSSSSLSGWTQYDVTNSWGDWGGWSSWQTDSVSSNDGRQVDTKKQYRYRDISYTTQYTSWGSWSGWQNSYVASNDLTDVETRTAYYYYYYRCPNCGAHMHVHGSCYTWAGGCGYSGADFNYGCLVEFYSSVSYSNTSDWKGTGRKYTDSTENGRAFIWYPGSTYYVDPITQYRYRTRSTYQDKSYGSWSSWSDNSYSSSSTREVETRTMYRYRTRSQVSTYYYYRWKDWSSWSTTAVSGNDNRQVEKATYYRYRDRMSVPTYHFSRWKDWSSWSTTTVSQSSTRKVETATFYRYRDKLFQKTYYFHRWTDWSDYSDVEVEPSDTVKVQTKTQYRYKLKTG